MGQQVWCVRHGQSTWNAERRIQGQAVDPVLTPLGQVQAAHAGTELVASLPPGPVAVVCSDLPRAVETTNIIMGTARWHRATVVSVTPVLREQSLGVLEGQLIGDVGEVFAPEGVHFSDHRLGGGESLADVYERLAVGLAPIVARAVAECGAGNVVVVSHGDTLRVLQAYSDGLKPRDIGWDPWPNGHIRALTVP